MATKKFLNDPKDAVNRALDALLLTNPAVERLDETNVIVRKNVNPETVAIVCGGGAGHEPAHSGFVADGLLTAAVCGDVFASPPHASISATLAYLKEKGCGKKGVLVIVKNYGGDLLNFGFAVRMARSESFPVEMVIVGDDVALGCTGNSRRGIAGTVALYKALGAAANQGAQLKELVSLAHHMNLNTRSMGASLTSCSVPGSGPTVNLGANEMEIGLGIHGEKGAQRCSVLSASDTVEALLTAIIQGSKLSETWARGTHVALMVNNLGATTDIEMGVVTWTAMQQLETFYSLKCVAISVGRFMTSLDMHGISLTLIQIQPTPRGSELLDLLLQPCPLISFTQPQAIRHISRPKRDALPNDTEGSSDLILRRIIQELLEHLSQKRDYFNQLDADVGDGDIGSGVQRVADRILPLLPSLPMRTRLKASVQRVAEVVAESFAGTSGPLYGAFILEASYALHDCFEENTTETFLDGFVKGTKAVMDLGGAKPGDRTMVDVLWAVSQEIGNIEKEGCPEVKDLLTRLLKVAEDKAKEVRDLPAKQGRSRYLVGKEVGLPDPGCELVVEWLRFLSERISI